MAEFWKSAPRFWCKQCKIYIRDTAFEKSQHEASGKHQGNLKRFLRDIHRSNEQQQRETQKAKNEVERLRQTVSGSAAPSGERRTATAVAQPSPASAERPVSVEERKKQMAQLAEMGISIPEEFRGDMALTGDWQTTSVRVIQPENKEGEKEGKGAEGRGIGVRKRKHEGPDDEEDYDDDGAGHGREPRRIVSKGWGQRTKEYPDVHGGDDEDLDALLASTKNVKKVKPSVPEGEEPPENVPGPVKEEGGDTAIKPEEASQVKEEEPSDAAASGPEPPVKDEPGEPASGVVFKKRKPKAIRK